MCCENVKKGYSPLLDSLAGSAYLEGSQYSVRSLAKSISCPAPYQGMGDSQYRLKRPVGVANPFSKATKLSTVNSRTVFCSRSVSGVHPTARNASLSSMRSMNPAVS